MTVRELVQYSMWLQNLFQAKLDLFDFPICELHFDFIMC